MFFIARTVPAMLMGFCGSYNTTATCESKDDSDIGKREAKEPLGLVTVPPKIDEFTGRARENELAAPALAARSGLVDEEVEPQLLRARRQREIDRHDISGR